MKKSEMKGGKEGRGEWRKSERKEGKREEGKRKRRRKQGKRRNIINIRGVSLSMEIFILSIDKISH